MSAPVSTRVHLIRHGAVDNPRNVLYGRLPGFHLSAAGRREVEETTLSLVHRKISHIYTSPLDRTQQTATLIGLAFPHAPVTLDDRLLELRTPKQFEGKSRTIGFQLPLVSTAESESGADVVLRLRHFLEEKIIQHLGSEIVAVCHGHPIALVINALLFESPFLEPAVYPDFGSIYALHWRGLALDHAWYQNIAADD